MIEVFLADGFEEIEATAPIDILRRAGAQVTAVGVSGLEVRGSHGTVFTADRSAPVKLSELEAVVLPGGMPGTVNLEKSRMVQEALAYAMEKELPVAAICAAPSILAHLGCLEGKKATCAPGFVKELGESYMGGSVVRDGAVLTAQGAGAALDFSLELVNMLYGDEKAAEIAKKICYRHYEGINNEN